MNPIDAIESKGLELNFCDIREKSALLNRSFDSSVTPVDGIYGTTTKIKDNGVVEKTIKLGNHHYQKEYYNSGGILYKIREATPGKSTTIDCDDLGTAYLRTETVHGTTVPQSITRSLIPDTTVTKGNFTARTDGMGRLISAKLGNVKINNADRPNTTRFKNSTYLPTDDVGHMMGHNLGGPTGPENLLPQNQNVNRSAFRKVESEVKSLVEQGKTVEYEMKINYEGSNHRPSSFEPKISVDGQNYDLPDDLKKIYNEADMTPAKKIATDIREVYGIAHEVGIKSGLVAAGITFAVSTVDNVSAYLDGEITAEEMVVDIVTETAAAGVIEYGSELISATVSHAMSKSSSALIQKVAGSSLPVAIVSFAVESYDCIADYAKGEIDRDEFVYELGDSAASVAGAMTGAAMGASVGSAVGPVGTFAGLIIGGVVGSVVTSEIYATAVELGAEGIEYLAQKAEGFMQQTVELFEEHIPEKFEEVKMTFTEFIDDFKLPFDL